MKPESEDLQNAILAGGKALWPPAAVRTSNFASAQGEQPRRNQRPQRVPTCTDEGPRAPTPTFQLMLVTTVQKTQNIKICYFPVLVLCFPSYVHLYCCEESVPVVDDKGSDGRLSFLKHWKDAAVFQNVCMRKHFNVSYGTADS